MKTGDIALMFAGLLSICLAYALDRIYERLEKLEEKWLK